MYFTGVRIDEVLAVKPSDLNLATNSIRMNTIKQGKNKKIGLKMGMFRIIPLHSELMYTYLQYLLDLNTKSEDSLFPMSSQVVNLYFKKIQEKLGFKIHAHKFRHTFVVKAVLDDLSLNSLK
ncbi:tyrosine-type recombinase/integrase [Caldiplasma sukawensis]